MNAIQKRRAESIPKLQQLLENSTKPQEQAMLREALIFSIREQLKSKAERIF